MADSSEENQIFHALFCKYGKELEELNPEPEVELEEQQWAKIIQTFIAVYTYISLKPHEMDSVERMFLFQGVIWKYVDTDFVKAHKDLSQEERIFYLFKSFSLEEQELLSHMLMEDLCQEK